MDFQTIKNFEIQSNFFDKSLLIDENIVITEKGRWKGWVFSDHYLLH